jgi:hypothetical protein
MQTPPEQVLTLGTNRSDRFSKPVRPVSPNRSGRLPKLVRPTWYNRPQPLKAKNAKEMHKLPFDSWNRLQGCKATFLHLSFCDAPGFQPGLLTLMIRSNKLNLVKRRSTWTITSKTSPTTPNDTLGQLMVKVWSKPWSNPLNAL